jgi:hypothetical protein
MIVKVRWFNDKQETKRTDSYTAQTVKIQPAGLVEIIGYTPGSTNYVRIYPTDRLIITIEDNDAQPKQ